MMSYTIFPLVAYEKNLLILNLFQLGHVSWKTTYLLTVVAKRTLKSSVCPTINSYLEAEYLH